MVHKRARGGKSSSTSSRPAKIRKVKEVVFDEDARKEFLTGFSKRKKLRQAAVRNKAIEREREEKNEARRTIREERKERAAQNVRTAKELYGDAASGDEDLASENSSGDSDAQIEEPIEFESSDLITTVSVEPFSLSRSPSPAALEPLLPLDSDPTPSTDKKTSRLQTSSHKRRVKNKPQARQKMSRDDKKERAKGSKKVKTAFAKGSSGTKGKGNKG